MSCKLPVRYMEGVLPTKHRATANIDCLKMGNPTFIYPLLGAHPRLLSALCISPTVSPSRPTDSHNWSAAPRGATSTQNHARRIKTEKIKETTSAISDEFLDIRLFVFVFLVFLLLRQSPGPRSVFSLCYQHFSFSFIISWDFPPPPPLASLPATSSISPPTLSPPPPPPSARIDSQLSVRHGLKNLTDVRWNSYSN